MAVFDTRCLESLVMPFEKGGFSMGGTIVINVDGLADYGAGDATTDAVAADPSGLCLDVPTPAG